jgi:hypothetical protein
VSFDHPISDDEIAGFEVVFVHRSINAATMKIDRDAFERLIGTPGVVAIEADGTVSAF